MVQCPECGNRYDAGALGHPAGFCTRCGANAPAPGAFPAGTAAPAAPIPNDGGARRRAQAGGILLVAIGALFLLGSCAGLLVPASDFEQALQPALANLGASSLPAGALHLLVLEDGSPVAANVSLLAAGTSHWTNATTSPSGWWNVSLERYPAANLTVAKGNLTLQRHVLALAGQNQTVVLDLKRDAPVDGHWIGLQPVLQLLKGFLVAMAVAAALMLAGGVCAASLRLQGLAVGGPIPLLAFMLLVAVATLNVGMLVLLLLQATGLALVASGRRAFHRRLR
jgi:hypothetical protein